MSDGKPDGARRGVNVRAVLFWVLLLGGLVVVAARRQEAEQLARTLATGRPVWVGGAVLLQCIFFTCYAALYAAAFRAVDVRARVRDLLPVWFASIFVNTFAPTAGPALFVDDAARRGESPARAAAGLILVRLCDNVTFFAVLVAGLGFLALHHDLRPFEVGAAAVLLLVIGGWTSVLLLGLWKPSALRKLLGGVERFIGGLFAKILRRPSPLGPDWAERQAGEFAGAAGLLAAHPRRLALPLAVALAAHLVDLSSIAALFLAFRHPVGPGVLTAGYAVGVLFWIVSVTPEGVGTVEGIMTLTYTTLGVPAPTAAAVTLAFRGLTYYLPLAVGLFCVRRVTHGIHGPQRRS